MALCQVHALEVTCMKARELETYWEKAVVDFNTAGQWITFIVYGCRKLLENSCGTHDFVTMVVGQAFIFPLAERFGSFLGLLRELRSSSELDELIDPLTSNIDHIVDDRDVARRVLDEVREARRAFGGFDEHSLPLAELRRVHERFIEEHSEDVLTSALERHLRGLVVVLASDSVEEHWYHTFFTALPCLKHFKVWYAEEVMAMAGAVPVRLLLDRTCLGAVGSIVSLVMGFHVEDAVVLLRESLAPRVSLPPDAKLLTCRLSARAIHLFKGASTPLDVYHCYAAGTLASVL